MKQNFWGPSRQIWNHEERLRPPYSTKKVPERLDKLKGGKKPNSERQGSLLEIYPKNFPKLSYSFITKIFDVKILQFSESKKNDLHFFAIAKIYKKNSQNPPSLVGVPALTSCIYSDWYLSFDRDFRFSTR